MAKKDTKKKGTEAPKVNENCGCLIDEFIVENSPDKERLCSIQEADFEVFTDPDAEKVSNEFYIKNQTDGLPIIPPTRSRVDKFLKYSDLKPEEIIAILPPKRGKTTLEKVAINAVMAGCLSNFMPVVQHAVKAVSQEKFNLPGINATTHPISICAIVNGPVSTELAINSGAGCLGPGNIANATIGRALRLSMINIAGAVPGIGDHATMGSPAKYSFCFAEAESESPWEPLHVEIGYKSDVSTVTMMAAEAPQNVNDHRSTKAEDLLDTIIHTAAVAGCNNSHVPGELLIIMGPEHAKTVYDDGWTKDDVKKYIHEKAIVPVELGDRGGRKLDEKWIIEGMVKITRSPEDVVLVVAGGPGRHSMVAPGFGTSSESVTLPLTLKDGTAAKSVDDFKKR
ncbi:MAG: hypothetical protein HVN34_07445 [Methanobacteriaceae archaeon]|nr:hypothetical protein [Methanobacteriaceae archaeon]OPY23804.1 MAG: hypothetical protein A4E26_00645 [Methanobacterium sp. PtaU1.Bin097]